MESTTTRPRATCTPSAGDPIAIPSALLARAVTAMIDPGVAVPPDSDGLIGRYFWNIVIARPASVPAALRYNPEYTASILEGGEESVIALANDLATAPCDGATLRRVFDENRDWLYGTISRERYVETGLAGCVEGPEGGSPRRCSPYTRRYSWGRGSKHMARRRSLSEGVSSLNVRCPTPFSAGSAQPLARSELRASLESETVVGDRLFDGTIGVTAWHEPECCSSSWRCSQHR